MKNTKRVNQLNTNEAKQRKHYITLGTKNVSKGLVNHLFGKHAREEDKML